MSDGVSITIGDGKVRELRFGIKSVLHAEKLLGGEDLQAVTFHKLSTFNLVRIAAAGFSTADKKISPPQVEAWIEAEPAKVAELKRAVVRAVALHLVDVGEMTPSEMKFLGEALDSAARASAGTADSALVGDTGSTTPPT